MISPIAVSYPSFSRLARSRRVRAFTLRVERTLASYRNSLREMGPRLPRLMIERFGLVLIVATMLLPPVGFALVSVSHLRQSAGEQATTGARHVAVRANMHVNITSDAMTDITTAVVYATRSANDTITSVWVSDANGLLIAFEGDKSSWPELQIGAPIHAARFNGVFHVSISLRDVIVGTLLTALAFICLGLAANFCFRRLPLAALDEAMRQLDEKHDELETRRRELAQQNLLFSAALDNMSQGLCMFDGERRLIVCNKRYRDMYGLTVDDAPVGTSLDSIVELRISKGVFAEGSPQHYREEMREPVLGATYKIQNLSDGRSIALSRSPMGDGGWVATHQDITEQRQQEQQIAFLARHDVLTELPNRNYFNDKLETALRSTSRGLAVAVMYLDLDGFKEVNDCFGHHTGDELLRAVGVRLRAQLREHDMVARLGGDEFAVIQVGGNQPGDAAITATRLIQAVKIPLEIGRHHVSVGLSIGIAVAPVDGTTSEVVLHRADVALYESKKSGNGCYRFFEPDMGEKLRERRAFEHDLRQALEYKEFSLHYQPIVQLDDDTICGFEALLRWSHPERGNVPPGQFIPVAEEIGLIDQIGEWVLREACHEVSGWAEHIRVAVNVSANQLAGGKLTPVVLSALAASGLEARRLELEVTESVFLGDGENALQTLKQLKSLGVRIALDDFGVGYSSLSYLRQFTFDRIKLDRYFVGGAGANAEADAIVRAVAGIGSSLGIKTTAEGIETADQLSRVRSEGYSEVQGFLLHRPVVVEEARRLAGLSRHATEALRALNDSATKQRLVS